MADQFFVLEPVKQDKEQNRRPDVSEVIFDRKVNELLKLGLIRPSTSEWSGGAFILLKKSNTNEASWSNFRLLVDYRGLNEATILSQPSNPVTFNRIFPLLQGNWYSIIDCKADFPCHPIPMSENSRDKTAFTIPNGNWEFNYMPYGLKTSSGTFKLLLSKTLLGLLGQGAVAYGDYIIVCSHDVESNCLKSDQIFTKLLHAGLKPNWKGSVFANSSIIKILGQ